MMNRAGLNSEVETLNGKSRSGIGIWHARGPWLDCWRLADPTFAQAANARSNHLEQVLPEPNADEDVEKRVEAGVGERQAPRHLSSDVEMGDSRAVCDVGVGGLHRLHDQRGVIGQLGEDEHKHHNEDDAQGFVLLKVPGLQEVADDDGVAGEHDQKGETKTHANLHGEHQDLGAVERIIPVDQCTIWQVSIRLHLSKDELGEGQQSGEKPDADACKLAIKQPLLLQVLSFGDLYDGDVSVYTNAGEKEHAAEEVDLIDSGDYFTQRKAKVPALYSIDGPKGQHAEEEEVGHGQVQQVHVSHCLQTVAHSRVNPDHHYVAHCTQDEDDPEQRGLVVASKVPDPALLAHARVSGVVVVTRGGFLQTETRR